MLRMQNSTWIGGFKIHFSSRETEDGKVRAIAKNNTSVEKNLERQLMSRVAENLQWYPVGNCRVARLVSGYGKVETTSATFPTAYNGRQGRDRKTH